MLRFGGYLLRFYLTSDKVTLHKFSLLLTAACLAQLVDIHVERQSAVREVEGSNPRLDQHSGS